MRLVPPPVITVDGPSGAGKGTLCRALAQQLGWHLLDSGVIYRLLALAAERHHIDITAEAQLVALATDLEARFITDAEGVHVLLAGQEVTLHLAEERVGAAASRLAVLPAVRAALLHRQRVFRQFPGLVADGRDMGTVVFPDAIAKIFLYASLEARTQRRLQQLQQKGFSVRFEQLLQEMRERDQRDTARSVASLVAAEDALLLDSTTLPIERVIDQALHYIQRQSAFSVRQCQV